LEFTELFEEYLTLFEGTLERFLEREGATIEAFYREVSARGGDDDHDHDRLYQRMLLALTLTMVNVIIIFLAG
jgi:hypothetical protein